MSHAPILPVLVPLVAAILLAGLHKSGIVVARAISIGAALLFGLVAVWLVVLADDGAVRAYRIGDWPAPYGIVLVLDRLSAIMVAVTAALMLPVTLFAVAGRDTHGRHFHALLQLQVMGLAGAFLTGDIFNLFVFFEILLLASYALLAHGGGIGRARAGLAYVVLNLAGSALFLFGLGLLYGTLGTLNLADIGVVLAGVPVESQALVRTTAALLAAVFLLKAAILPLSFWLPHVYAAASAPVAALFAVMTKVGVYAILRCWGSAFGAAPFTADLLGGWLTLLAVATIAAGAVGALAAPQLGGVVANLVLVSTGTLLVALPAADPRVTAAFVYYLVHTVLVTGGLFLLAGVVAEARGNLRDTIERGPRLQAAAVIGTAFLLLATAVSGLPPLSGFLGKLMLLQAMAAAPLAWLVWTVVLASGLVVALVLARAASALFWEPDALQPSAPVGAGRAGGAGMPVVLAVTLLVAASPVLTAAAGPVSRYASAAAAQLHARQPYVDAVLGVMPRTERERRP